MNLLPLSKSSYLLVLLASQYVASMETARNALDSGAHFLQKKYGDYYQENQEFAGQVDSWVEKKSELLGRYLTDSIIGAHGGNPAWKHVSFQCFPDRIESGHIDCFARADFEQKSFSAKFARFYVYALTDVKPSSEAAHVEYQTRLKEYQELHQLRTPFVDSPCIQELVKRSSTIFQETFDEAAGLYGLCRVWGESHHGGEVEDYLEVMVKEAPDLFFSLFGYPTVNGDGLPNACANVFPAIDPMIAVTPIPSSYLDEAAQAFANVELLIDPNSGVISGTNYEGMDGTWTISETQYPNHKAPDNFKEDVLEALDESAFLTYPVFYDMTLPAPILTKSPLAIPAKAAINSSLWRSTLKAGPYWIAIIPDTENSLAQMAFATVSKGLSSGRLAVQKKVMGFRAGSDESLSCFKFHFKHIKSITGGYYMTICWVPVD